MNPVKHKAIVFDLDGCLSDGKHRLHLLPKYEDRADTNAWSEFNLASDKDEPIQDNIDLLNILSLTHRIIILTGRGAVAKDVTLDWLDKYGVNYDNLIMRGPEDHRPDVEYKESILLPMKDNIVCCFDDLEHVAKHIRGLGITCHLTTHYDAPLLHQRNHRNEEAVPCCTASAEDIELIAKGDFTPEELWGGPRPTCHKCIGGKQC